MNGSSGPVAQAVNTITNAANAAVTNTANAFKNVATTVTNAANKAVNQAAPAINSLIPFGSPNSKKNNAAVAMSAAANTRKNNGGVFGAVSNAVTNAANAVANVASPPPTAANLSVTPVSRPWLWPVIIFGVLVVIFITIFALFSEQIKAGYETVAASFKQALGLSTQPAVQAQIVPMEGEAAPVTQPPKPPQDVLPDEEQEQIGRAHV